MGDYKEAPPADADRLLDRCVRILDRALARMEAADVPLTSGDIAVIVKVAHAAREIVAVQLDPLGDAGRRKLGRMTDAELREAKRRLDGVS